MAVVPHMPQADVVVVSRGRGGGARPPVSDRHDVELAVDRRARAAVAALARRRAGEQTLGEAEAGGELEVVAGRSHRGRHQRAIELDLQRLLDDQLVGLARHRAGVVAVREDLGGAARDTPEGCRGRSPDRRLRVNGDDEVLPLSVLTPAAQGRVQVMLMGLVHGTHRQVVAEVSPTTSRSRWRVCTDLVPEQATAVDDRWSRTPSARTSTVPSSISGAGRVRHHQLHTSVAAGRQYPASACAGRPLPGLPSPAVRGTACPPA